MFDKGKGVRGALSAVEGLFAGWLDRSGFTAVDQKNAVVSFADLW
ncbi:hypothetical protein PV726_09395 [Streptomyces europaeiscabiei]|nr:hypothetical protein [Streptomyces europaeiscabiei]MDX3690532.1 hypothetical protein [Streptomyces europaeiscabiei]